MNSEFISHEEVASRLKLSRPYVTKLLKSGEIPGRKVHHGVPRVCRKTFETWVLERDL